MFGFNKDNPLGNVTREDFNIYKIELLDRLGLIQKSLNKLIEFRQIEKRQKIEQELEQTNIVRKEIEPEKIKEETKATIRCIPINKKTKRKNLILFLL